ncbi:hypothetical protein C3731_17665 [Brucella oryzae]|uniref:Uncharacterized protein n=1 Tax=Brucella oryzae TaxID=335286 RepID=A0A2S7IW82_9HYPH|nr:hypothetical protein C3731_17665 [Brucella oryzae]
MDQLFSPWLLIAVALFSMIAGLMNIVSVIFLRNRLFDLESMIIWKWSEAPWWTRIEPENSFQANLAQTLLKRECQHCVCNNNACQSGVTEKEN